jgi:RNA polymerase sigma-70 factor (ECF subfamily)
MDHARFEDVFLLYLQDAYRLARWLVGSHADAEDIVQEAAIRAFQGVDKFRGGNPRAWTLMIVRNVTYSWLAKNRPAVIVLTNDLSQAEQAQLEASEKEVDTPETALLAKADGEQVRKAIASLPLPFSEVLVLREINELSYSDIATLMDIPVGTVMSRLARARNMLAASLGRDEK